MSVLHKMSKPHNALGEEEVMPKHDLLRAATMFTTPIKRM